MKSLLARYCEGTLRLAAPAETLARIAPHLRELGITRCADVSGLGAAVGVPTYCVIRPTARLPQTSSGKGITSDAARVSGLMEAIELHHIEHPDPGAIWRASFRQAQQEGKTPVLPARLPKYRGAYFDEGFRIDWCDAEELIRGARVSVPASAVYDCEPSLYRMSTNGVASGNHLVEATLHALYEIIERDALASMNVGGLLRIREACRVVDLPTLSDPRLREVIAAIEAAGSQIVLLWVRSRVAVSTFWAVLLDPTPLARDARLNTACNMGFGSHLDPTVAAFRAVTEAIQSWLAVTHGAREDLSYKAAEDVVATRAFGYFSRLEGDAPWPELAPPEAELGRDLGEHLTQVLGRLSAAGHEEVYRVSLTKAAFAIPVVKVLVPGMRVDDVFHHGTPHRSGSGGRP